MVPPRRVARDRARALTFGVVSLWSPMPARPTLISMIRAMRERRSVSEGHPGDGSGREFQERRLDYGHERLRQAWTGCPDCGGHILKRPSAADLDRVPEAAGVCGTCGAALISTAVDKPRVVTERRRR
jgi:hypothetical protein